MEYPLFWWKVVDSNHRSHRRQIYSLEQPRRIPKDFGVIPLLFPCSLDKYHFEVDALFSNSFTCGVGMVYDDVLYLNSYENFYYRLKTANTTTALINIMMLKYRT